MTANPLFEAFPEVASRFPSVALGTFPTRVHRLERLGADIGARELWIKRDDESAEAYGGNKIRKLEFLLADAKAKGASKICAVGGIGSNLMVAVSIFGPAHGLDVHMAAVSQEMTDHARDNLRAALASGTTVELVTPRASVAARLAARYLRDRVIGNGARPYYLLPGGSSPIGTLGFVGAVFELKKQIDAGELPEPKLIVVPHGSGGTVAGLTLGARLAGLRSRVLGVRVVERSIANRPAAALLATATGRLLHRAGARIEAPRFSPRHIEVDQGFFGGAYGRPTVASHDAVARMQDLEGIPLEPTYTGKALAALFARVRTERLYREPVLFWNTVSSVRIRSLVDSAPKREQVDERLRPFLD